MVPVDRMVTEWELYQEAQEDSCADNNKSPLAPLLHVGRVTILLGCINFVRRGIPVRVLAFSADWRSC